MGNKGTWQRKKRVSHEKRKKVEILVSVIKEKERLSRVRLG